MPSLCTLHDVYQSSIYWKGHACQSFTLYKVLRVVNTNALSTTDDTGASCGLFISLPCLFPGQWISQHAIAMCPTGCTHSLREGWLLWFVVTIMPISDCDISQCLK
jgi:hypothetical protein